MRRIEKKKKKAGNDFPNTDVALSIKRNRGSDADGM